MSSCPDAKYSAKPVTDYLSFNDQRQNRYTPNASMFMVYNNTNTVVIFNNIPFSPGGFACFDELKDTCYDQEMEYSVPPGSTGQFIITKMVKTPAKGIDPGQAPQQPQAGNAGTQVKRWS